MTDVDPYEGWAVLELMGHRRLAGHLSEQTIGGASFLRLDIPGEEGKPPVTQFYSGASVYCITPCDEETARAVAASLTERGPISRYELPQIQAAGSGQKNGSTGIFCGNCEEWAEGYSYGDECPNCGARLHG